MSDYARFWILYNYGGLYFQTDVEVTKSTDDIIERGPFIGIELGATRGVFSRLSHYALAYIARCWIVLSVCPFIMEDGRIQSYTMTPILSEILVREGLLHKNDIQFVYGVWIYPKDYFNPLNDNTGVLKITDNTRSIHWYSKTWLRKRNPVRIWVIRIIHRIFGDNSLTWVRSLLKK